MLKLFAKNKTSLAGDTINLSIANIITTLITLVTAMLLSRYLTKTEYGTYSSAFIVVNLAVSFFTLGLPHSITYFLSRAETQEERSRFLSTYYILTTVLSIMAGLILVLGISVIIDYFKNPLIRSIWFFLAIVPWTKMIISSFNNTLVALKRTKLLLFFKVISSLAVVAIILICGFLEVPFTTYIFIFVALESLVTVVSYVLIAKNSQKLSLTIDRKLIKAIFKFSIPVGLAAMVGFVDKEFDKLFMGNVLSTENLATYANAAKELPLTFISMSFISTLLPRLTRFFKDNEMDKGIGLWKDCTILSSWILSYCALAICAFAPDVVTFLYSEKYLDGVSIFRIYTILLIIRCTYFAMALNALGKTKFILYSSIIGILSNIILNFVLYYTIGVLGPAIATVIANLVGNFILLAYTSKKINIRIKDIFPFKSVFIILLANIILAVIFYYIKILLPLENFLGSLVESIFLSLLWGVLVFFIFKKMIMKKYRILKQE